MTEEHYCQTHQCKFYKNEKNGKTWYSHKIKGGDGYCNEPKGQADVVQATPSPTSEESKSSPTPKESGSKPPPEHEMTKGDWSEKDRITRKSIERQTALKEAANIACAVIAQGKEMSPAKVIDTAKLFEAYLEGQLGKSRLVEEAEKLGLLP